MATATLTSGAPSTDFTTTAGALYSIAASGGFGGGIVGLSYSLTATPTVFQAFQAGDFNAGFAMEVRAPGTKLRAAVANADRSGAGTTSITVDLTSAA